MPKAPRGAVIKMANTDIVKMSSPAGSPIARGTQPIAAWTVAFGRYAIKVKVFSFESKSVPIKLSQVPIIRIPKAKRITRIGKKPAEKAYWILTEAPTKINKKMAPVRQNGQQVQAGAVSPRRKGQGTYNGKRYQIEKCKSR